MSDEVRTIKFDAARATRLYPRPILRHAILVNIPRTEGGVGLSSSLKVSWGEQSFAGRYYMVVSSDGGESRRGSARDEWEAMHRRLRPGWWVKTGVPIGYKVEERCKVGTYVERQGRPFLETTAVLEPGDWVLIQPLGEIQHVRREKFPDIYFLPEEAKKAGLTRLTAEEFADWAVETAREQNSWLALLP